jgi:hypothetical protein
MASEFPFIKLISPENMVGFSEAQKIAQLHKIFTDSYKSPMSIIVVDSLERLLGRTWHVNSADDRLESYRSSILQWCLASPRRALRQAPTKGAPPSSSVLTLGTPTSHSRDDLKSQHPARYGRRSCFRHRYPCDPY